MNDSPQDSRPETAQAHGTREARRYAGMNRRNLLLMWLVFSSLAAAVCCLMWPAAHLSESGSSGVVNELLPVGNDSFYHARRILDTAADPSSFYQFDPKIHAPEGSLLTWPWGYDYVLGIVVRMGMRLGLAAEPMALLVWIPVLAVAVSVGLMLLLARELELPSTLIALAAFCMAVSPLTQNLHGLGMIDHHYAEYIFTLLSLLLGLRWLAEPNEIRRAVAAGIALGLAPAMHNSLFVLQLPLLICLFAFWVQRIQIPQRASLYFSLTMLVTTFCIVLPSLPFRLGRFEFQTLSWFHLYVAFCSAIVTVVLSRTTPGRSSYLAIAMLGLVAAAPVVKVMGEASSFLGGTLVRLEGIYETQSLTDQLEQYGWNRVLSMYSMFVLLLPLTFGLCLWKAWRERGTNRMLFWIASICGLAMLISQFRFHYFGSFALYLPWIIVLHEAATRWPQYGRFAIVAGMLATLLMYYQPVRYQLVAQWAPALDPSFPALRPLLTTLKDACAKEPGIVLADNDAGHYIRYYTDCSVIANNFLLTRQHVEKIREIDRLRSMHADDLPRAAPYVRYVLIRPLNVFLTGPRQYKYVSHGDIDSKLLEDLLITDAETPGYTLLGSTVLPHMNNIPHARLYRIERK